MERTTLEVIAPSIEEAVSRGIEQLGVSRDLLDVDVLDEGSRGFLGIGGRQVRVRLTLKSAEQEPVTAAPAQADPAAAPVEEDRLLAYAAQVTREMLLRMKVSARVSTRYANEPDSDGDLPVLIDIRGDDLSILIGRRAETLNALQYLLALIVSKEADRWVQVVVDVEGYRTRRENQLRQLARRMADQAIRTGKRQILEPMSAAERRIIHLELRNHAEVTTESVGEEPSRKVSIILKKKD
jgi:spoIIIJ-associated protein